MALSLTTLVAYLQELQPPPTSSTADHLRVCANGDVVFDLDLTHELGRHAGGYGRSAHDHGYGPGGPEQMNGRLTGRIATTNHEDLAVSHGFGLGHGGTVIDTHADQALELG